MPSVSGTIGSLLAKSLENAIKQAKFEGREVDIWIGKGFFEKPFTIKYSDAEAQNVKDFLQRVQKDLEQKA